MDPKRTATIVSNRPQSVGRAGHAQAGAKPHSGHWADIELHGVVPGGKGAIAPLPETGSWSLHAVDEFGYSIFPIV
jgi:hypothetical protein